MNLEMVDREIANTFSTYETSMENRIRYISGMHHFAEYLNNHGIELESVGETEIEQYAGELKSLGYPDIFVDTNIDAIRRYFSYPKRKHNIHDFVY